MWRGAKVHISRPDTRVVKDDQLLRAVGRRTIQRTFRAYNNGSWHRPGLAVASHPTPIEWPALESSAESLTNSIDLALFHWLNGLARQMPWLDDIMIGCARYAPVVFALVLVACWLRWRPDWQRAAALAGVAALLALGTGQLVGMAFPRARPYAVTTATVLVPHAPDTSFPSDHATLALAVTVVLTTMSRRLAASLALFSVLVLVARVYIGVHYPTDVLGGAALGALGAWLTLRLARIPTVADWIDAVLRILRRIGIAAPVMPAQRGKT